MSPLPKGRSNSGVKNLVPFHFPKGKSGYSFPERTIACKCCGKDFVTRGTWSKYCSESCKEKSRPDGQKKDFVCQFCGKPFKRRAFNNACMFCSRQCSGLWSTATGKQSYFYKAFLGLPHKCNRCGIDDFSVLIVHHKDRNRNNNDLSNLEILCANCHYRIHFGNGKVRHKKIIPILDYLRKKNNESSPQGQVGCRCQLEHTGTNELRA